MDIPIVGQASPADQALKAGHGGGHGKAKPTQAPVPGARTDSVRISDAARLAAQRAAERAAEDRERVLNNANKRHHPGRKFYQQDADADGQDRKPGQDE